MSSREDVIQQALLDADSDPDDLDPIDGQCVRLLGHPESVYPLNKHVTYDRDHYDEWLVGWTPLRERVALVMAMTPLATGAETLARVKQLLRDPAPAETGETDDDAD